MENSEIIVQNAISDTEKLLDMTLNQEDIFNNIKEKISYLLDNEFNILINILYRIDVYEHKAKQCFGQPNDQIAECLTKLIWERQLQKAETRIKYW